MPKTNFFVNPLIRTLKKAQPERAFLFIIGLLFTATLDNHNNNHNSKDGATSRTS